MYWCMTAWTLDIFMSLQIYNLLKCIGRENGLDCAFPFGNCTALGMIQYIRIQKPDTELDGFRAIF